MVGPSGAGRLRQRIRFQRRALTDDGYGNKVGDWVDLFTPRPADLTPRRGGIEVQAQRAQGVAQYDCWVRYDPETASITVDDRVIEDATPAKAFKIVFAGDLDGKCRWILLQLELGGAT